MAARGAHLLALLAAAVALTACGGSASVDGAAVARAASTTANVPSYEVSARTTIELPVLGTSVTIAGEGAFDPQAQRGRMSLDLRQLAAVLRQPYGSALLVLSGSDVYMRIPLLRAAAPTLKPWVKVSIVKGGRASGLDFSSFLQFGQGGDPTQTLQYLRAAGDVKKVGEEDVRGVPTTHYHATIELAKVPSLAPAKQRDRIRRQTRKLEQLTGEKTIPADVWIDRHDYVRRMTYRETLRLQGRRTPISVSLEFYDFGVEVVAPVPPADDVTDLTKLLPKGV